MYTKFFVFSLKHAEISQIEMLNNKFWGIVTWSDWGRGSQGVQTWHDPGSIHKAQAIEDKK